MNIANASMPPKEFSKKYDAECERYTTELNILKSTDSNIEGIKNTINLGRNLLEFISESEHESLENYKQYLSKIKSKIKNENNFF